jgi:hypothetical protein
MTGMNRTSSPHGQRPSVVSTVFASDRNGFKIQIIVVVAEVAVSVVTTTSGAIWSCIHHVVVGGGGWYIPDARVDVPSSDRGDHIRIANSRVGQTRLTLSSIATITTKKRSCYRRWMKGNKQIRNDNESGRNREIHRSGKIN